MKPEIPTTWYHRAVNLLCLILLVGIFAVLFIFWRDLPEHCLLYTSDAADD